MKSTAVIDARSREFEAPYSHIALITRSKWQNATTTFDFHEQAGSIPVVALTITHRPASLISAEQILVVVRRSETNLTHPDVVCVPTQKCPESIAHALTERTSDSHYQNRIWRFRGKPVSNASENDSHALIYAVNSILARKLGLADALEHKCISYRARLTCAASGISEVSAPATRGPEQLPIVMFNVVVRLLKGHELFPSESASYARILWTPISSFLESANAKSVTSISQDLSPFRYCIRGLCVATTCAVLSGKK